MLPKSSSKISCIKLALLSSAFSKLLKVVLFKLRLPSVVATNTRKPRQNKAIVFRKDIIALMLKTENYSLVLLLILKISKIIALFHPIAVPRVITLIWLLQN